MKAKLQRLEVQTAVLRDHDLAVEHAPLGKLRLERLDQLREIPVERLLISALDEQLVAVAENERAEPIPLGLVDPSFARRKVADAVREHRKDGRIDGKLHPGCYNTRAELSCAQP